jgi:hypothetical protein
LGRPAPRRDRGGPAYALGMDRRALEGAWNHRYVT